MSEVTELGISVAKMEVQVSQLEREMKEIKGDIKFIRQKLDQASGGWKVLMLVGGIGATLGGLLFKLIDVLGGK